MGCGNSKATDSVATMPTREPSVTRTKGPLSDQEIQSRIETCQEALTMNFPDYRIRFAFLSQRGYYPDALSKPNQDAFCVHTNFGSEDCAFFGVFDGHGREGHLCAQFARDEIPRLLLQYLKSGMDPQEALDRSHIEANRNLHAKAAVDDALSGTTAISVLFKGFNMYIANVGDSRAIIAQDKRERGSTTSKLKPKPLSYDQTPYRKDERERCKKYGARILSMDQIEGIEPIHENWGDVNLGEELDEGGDPPRIWSPHGEYPGTAFTRSVGDAIAEELGVTAEPEIVERELHPHDRFAVIASDGVFEFLTNQNVTDIVARYPDPLDACKVVVNQAYDLWLQYEIRTDDITMIAIYFEDIKHAPVRKSIALENIMLEGIRPVRRAMSREQRKRVMNSNVDDQDEKEEEVDLESLKTLKTPVEIAEIKSAMQQLFLFQHLSEQQKETVCEVMQVQDVRQGDVIIHQGDRGDQFYIVGSGTFDVHVQGSNSKEEEKEEKKTGEWGPVVHTYNTVGGQHPCFGELALMYSQPRAATVVAASNGRLWTLDRRVFRSIVMRSGSKRRDLMRTLRKVQILSSLSVHQLQRLCDILSEESFGKNATIIKQGEMGDKFYLIQSGSCDAIIDGNVCMHLKDNDYFGERALIHQEPRAASIRVTSNKCICLTVDKRGFEEVLGPLQDIIDEDRKLREERRTSNLVPSDVTSVRVFKPSLEDDISATFLAVLGSGSISDGCLRTFHKSTLVSSNLHSSILNSLDINNALLTSHIESPFLAYPMMVYNEPKSIHVVYDHPVVTDLSSRMEEGPLSFEETRDIFAPLASAIDAIHKANILFRSLTPESVYITATGSPVLMDFSISKLGLESTFTLCGVDSYMAPELVAQSGHSKEVDYWALGILLYEMLSGGENPFKESPEQSERQTYENIMNHTAGGDLKLPNTLARDASLVDLLSRLLDPNPQQRLASLSALQEHLWFGNKFNWDSVNENMKPFEAFATQRREELESEGFVELTSYEKPYEQEEKKNEDDDEDLFEPFNHF